MDPKTPESDPATDMAALLRRLQRAVDDHEVRIQKLEP